MKKCLAMGMNYKTIRGLYGGVRKRKNDDRSLQMNEEEINSILSGEYWKISHVRNLKEMHADLYTCSNFQTYSSHSEVDQESKVSEDECYEVPRKAKYPRILIQNSGNQPIQPEKSTTERETKTNRSLETLFLENSCEIMIKNGVSSENVPEYVKDKLGGQILRKLPDDLAKLFLSYVLNEKDFSEIDLVRRSEIVGQNSYENHASFTNNLTTNHLISLKTEK